MQGVFRGFKDTKTPLYATGKTKGLFGLRPQLASPRAPPPQNSNMSVADESSATPCGEGNSSVAGGGGSQTAPKATILESLSTKPIWSIRSFLHSEKKNPMWFVPFPTLLISVLESPVAGDLANIVLDPILISGCRMGVIGAAIAHVLSQ
jgi:hypothetical protein